MSSPDTGQRSSSPLHEAKSTPDEIKASNLAIFVHSQDTLNSNLPSSRDNQVNSRQKRRRTSPEDQAILEAEYEKNPKPDKAARADIVNRVALGEKEVQIWFQNRRQMTRRRSQPPSSFALDSSLYLSQKSLGSSVYSSFSLSTYNQSEPLSSQSSLPKSQPDCPQPNINMPVDKSDETLPSAAALRKRVSDKGPDTTFEPQRDSLSDIDKLAAPVHGTTVDLPIVDFAALSKKRPNGLVKRHTSPFSIHQDAQCVSVDADAHEDGSNKQNAAIPVLPATLRRTSSLVRLSTSLEGSAKVAVGDSPSPPKLRAPRPVTGLQRSQSVTEQKGSEVMASPAFMPQKASIPGRSRDSRTWEFYCDSNARDALTQQAEREQKGSAVNAIGLIRSRSNQALALNSHKRNARPEKLESTKRLKANDVKAHRRKLSRAKSSIARLQTVESGADDPTAGHRKPWKPSSQIELDDSGDSDKENWEPGTRSRAQHRRPAPVPFPTSRTARAVLEESLRVPSQSSSLDKLMRRENSASSQISDGGAKAGKKLDKDEVVDGGITATTATSQLPRGSEELDCVQNLLSLSQGAWQ
ncbi:MAG: hypothetical protein Q9191_006259 [Dirinaria sp. TL-2023a]